MPCSDLAYKLFLAAREASRPTLEAIGAPLPTLGPEDPPRSPRGLGGFRSPRLDLDPPRSPSPLEPRILTAREALAEANNARLDRLDRSLSREG